MKILTLLMCLFSVNAFANWQMEVAFGIDGETWKIDHAKFVEAKETEISFGNYVVKMTVKKGTTEEKGLDVSYSINEKKGEKLTLISKGEENLVDNGKGEIFAKGEPKQPNTIITLKFKNI